MSAGISHLTKHKYCSLQIPNPSSHSIHADKNQHSLGLGTGPVVQKAHATSTQFTHRGTLYVQKRVVYIVCLKKPLLSDVTGTNPRVLFCATFYKGNQTSPCIEHPMGQSLLNEHSRLVRGIFKEDVVTSSSKKKRPYSWASAYSILSARKVKHRKDFFE